MSLSRRRPEFCRRCHTLTNHPEGVEQALKKAKKSPLEEPNWRVGILHSIFLAEGVMEPYFFTLRNGQCGYSDPIGVELTNHEAALDYARLIAAELMKNREQETRRWRIEVRNNEGAKIGVVDFATKEKMPARDVPSVGTRSVERHG